jgi:hypothetical protein
MRSFCAELNMADFRSLGVVVARIYRIACRSGQPSQPPRRRNLLAAAGVDATSGLRARSRIMRDEEGRKIETGIEARAGFLDRPVLIVLGVSLTVLVIIFAALWLGFNFMTPPGA